MIIHVSGPPGSGKTTMMNELNKIYKNKSKYIIKDLDDLYDGFHGEKYQKFIDSFIKKHIKKNIIFVGLNIGKSDKAYYNVYPNHKFYIKLPIDINLKRYFLREFNSHISWLQNIDHELLYRKLLSNEDIVIKDLSNALTLNLCVTKHRQFILSFAEHYNAEKYQFLTYNQIVNKIHKLLN